MDAYQTSTALVELHRGSAISSFTAATSVALLATIHSRARVEVVLGRLSGAVWYADEHLSVVRMEVNGFGGSLPVVVLRRTVTVAKHLPRGMRN